MKTLIAYFIYLLFMAFLLSGTAYLIYWKGATQWLWLLMVIVGSLFPDVEFTTQNKPTQ